MGPTCHHKYPYKREVKGDLTQIEDRQYTIGRERVSTVTRPQIKGCRQPQQPRKLEEARAGCLLEILTKPVPGPADASDLGSVALISGLASKTERESIYVVLTTTFVEICHSNHRKLIQGDKKAIFKSS